MKIWTPSAAVAALSLTTLAHAGVVEPRFEIDAYGVTSGGSQVAMGSGAYGVMDLYVSFDFAYSSTKVLNLIDMNIGLDRGDFVHNDAGGADNWSAAFTVASLGADPAVDSFVTMGGPMGGDPFAATLDPNFDGSIGGSVSADAGWYNADPTNGQGIVDGADRVFIGRFVVDNADVTGNRLTVAGTVGYRFFGTSPGNPDFAFDELVYTMPSSPAVPGPAAVLALIGVSGLRRRRR